MSCPVTFALPDLGGGGGRGLWGAALTANGWLDPPPDQEVSPAHPLGLGLDPRLFGGQEGLGPIPHPAQPGPVTHIEGSGVKGQPIQGPEGGNGERSSGTDRSWGWSSESRMWGMGR